MRSSLSGRRRGELTRESRYTKALDEIKTLRKAQAIEIKVDKEKLAALSTDRDRATKVRLHVSSCPMSSQQPFRSSAA